MDENFMDQFHENKEEWARYDEHTACVNNAVTALTASETNKYAKRAEELFPDDFDTLRVCALAKIREACNDPVTKYQEYEKALKRADEIIREDRDGEFCLINDWYRSSPGRPYIRLKRAYARSLLDCGQFEPAKKQYEDIIALTHHDGYGDRYVLAAIYAFTGDRLGFKRLLKEYRECIDGEIALHASVCFFKNGDILNARKYLLRAFDDNKNYRTLVAKSINRNFRKKLQEISEECDRKEGVRIGSYEQCVCGITETMFLYDSVPEYFHWARLAAGNM